MKVICTECNKKLDSSMFTSTHKKCKDCRATIEKERRKIIVQESLIADSKLVKNVAKGLTNDSTYLDVKKLRKLIYVKDYPCCFKNYLSLSKQLPGVTEYNHNINMYNKEVLILIQSNLKKKRSVDEVKKTINDLSRQYYKKEMIDLEIKDCKILLEFSNDLLSKVQELYEQYEERKKNKDKDKRFNKTYSSSSSKSEDNLTDEEEEEDDDDFLISGLSDLSESEDENNNSNIKLRKEIDDLVTLLNHSIFSSRNPELKDKAKEKVTESIQKLRNASNLIDKIKP